MNKMGDLCSIPGSGRRVHSFLIPSMRVHPLEKEMATQPMDRGAWCTTVHGAAESDMTEHTL